MTDQGRVQGLRTLGAPRATRATAPKRTKTQTAVTERAKATLKKEFKNALGLKEKLAAEVTASGEAKTVDPKQAEKLRSIVASLEGMSRFAIAMELLTPAENRALWAGAMKKGLYAGWR